MPRQHDETSEVGHRTVTDASVMTFGCLTGDYSQMHFDLDYAHTAEMGGPIAHGLLSACWAVGAMTQHSRERLAIGDPYAYLAGFRIRFARMVHIGDRFSLRCRASDTGSGVEGLQGSSLLDTEFDVLNQRGEVSCTGALSVSRSEDAVFVVREPLEPLSIEPWSPDQVSPPLYAEDQLAHGPRGVSTGRTVTDADVVGFANFTGELNPLYLNDEFARSGPFGARVAPPMLTFCFGFGDYLRDLLSVPMPSTGFAGHLGDEWRFFAPVFIGDTIRVRHKPVRFEPSKSRAGMAIVQFGLQLENQRNEIVQDGRVTMMMPVRGGG